MDTMFNELHSKLEASAEDGDRFHSLSLGTETGDRETEQGAASVRELQCRPACELCVV